MGDNGLWYTTLVTAAFGCSASLVVLILHFVFQKLNLHFAKVFFLLFFLFFCCFCFCFLFLSLKKKLKKEQKLKQKPKKSFSFSFQKKWVGFMALATFISTLNTLIYLMYEPGDNDFRLACKFHGFVVQVF